MRGVHDLERACQLEEPLAEKHLLPRNVQDLMGRGDQHTHFLGVSLPLCNDAQSQKSRTNGRRLVGGCKLFRQCMIRMGDLLRGRVALVCFDSVVVHEGKSLKAVLAYGWTFSLKAVLACDFFLWKKDLSASQHSINRRNCSAGSIVRLWFGAWIILKGYT